MPLSAPTLLGLEIEQTLLSVHKKACLLDHCPRGKPLLLCCGNLKCLE